MTKTKVEMLKNYKFAELPQHGGQIVDSEEGEVHTVSLECAEELCAAKAARRVADEIPSEEEKVSEIEPKEGEACAMEDDSEGVVKDGKCVKAEGGVKDALSKLNPFQKDKKAAENS